jgi:hypothetical protein
MNFFAKLSVVTVFFLPPIAGWAGTQEEAKVVEQPPVKTIEPWQITVEGPGWLAGVSGHTGFHGVNPYVNVGVGQIGYQFTRNIFSEVGYRYYYDDFRDGNFLYQLSLHGAQVTVGLTF